MTAKITFNEYGVMIVTDESNWFNAVSYVNYVDNMGILEDALEQVAPEPLENIRDAYEQELDEAQDEEAENDAHYGYEQSVKELLQKNWDAVYAVVADDLLI